VDPGRKVLGKKGGVEGRRGRSSVPWEFLSKKKEGERGKKKIKRCSPCNRPCGSGGGEGGGADGGKERRRETFGSSPPKGRKEGGKGKRRIGRPVESF